MVFIDDVSLLLTTTTLFWKDGHHWVEEYFLDNRKLRRLRV
jgi:hypothetical protein